MALTGWGGVSVPEPLWRPHPHRGSDLERGSIGSDQIADGAIVTGDIANGTITKAKLSSEPWIDWTSTLANLTLGSGSVTSRWTRLGMTVHYLFIFELGAGSAVGTSPTFTLPVAPSASFIGDFPMGWCHLLDAGNTLYPGSLHFQSGSTVLIRYLDSTFDAVITNNIAATVPFTWGSGDRIMAMGTYEAAS